MTKYFWSNR